MLVLSAVAIAIAGATVWIAVAAGASLPLVSPNPPVTGTASSTEDGINIGTPQFPMKCTAGSLNFALDPGRPIAGGGMALGSITDSTWDGCKGPSNMPVVVTHIDAWRVQATTGLVGGTGE